MTSKMNITKTMQKNKLYPTLQTCNEEVWLSAIACN